MIRRAFILCACALAISAPADARSVGIHVRQGSVHFFKPKSTLAAWRRADREEDKQTGDTSDRSHRIKTQTLLFGIPKAPVFTFTPTTKGSNP